MIRKNKKFIDPRYFMDEKMEHDDPQKCPRGETWEGDEMGEGKCVDLNEARDPDGKAQRAEKK